MMQAVAFLAKTQSSSHGLQHWWKSSNMTAAASSAAAFLTDILRMCGARTDPLSILTPHQFVAVCKGMPYWFRQPNDQLLISFE